jgi:flagellar biogenesis protein FliO
MSPALVYGIAAAVAAATLYGAVRLFGRRPRAAEETEADAPTPELEVLSRKRVGFGRSLVIVEADGRLLLLGSTRQSWTALADLGRAPRGESGGTADPIDAELDRALQANRFRRGGRSR